MWGKSRVMSTISGRVSGSPPAITKKEIPSSSASSTMLRSFSGESSSGRLAADGLRVASLAPQVAPVGDAEDGDGRDGDALRAPSAARRRAAAACQKMVRAKNSAWLGCRRLTRTNSEKKTRRPRLSFAVADICTAMVARSPAARVGDAPTVAWAEPPWEWNTAQPCFCLPQKRNQNGGRNSLFQSESAGLSRSHLLHVECLPCSEEPESRNGMSPSDPGFTQDHPGRGDLL